jgi:hypothetical protein
MSDANRLLFPRIALIIVGLTFIFGIYILSVVWPAGWAWGHGHSHYLMMSPQEIPTLIRASSGSPYGRVFDIAERGHLVGDVPALILVAIILAALMPWTAQEGDRHNLSRPDLTVA